MINRQNYLHVRAYLVHTERVRQNNPETVKRNRAHLRHLLEWADETPLTSAKSLAPFPACLVEKGLAPASIQKCLTVARQFFEHMRTEHPHLYKPITDSWIESLQPPRSLRPGSRLPERTYYTLEDVLSLCTTPVDDLRLERAQAGVAMLYLSGMRAGALASLPRSCVDISQREIKQLPEFGVQTKNHKAALTYLLEIPQLLEVVSRWDARLRDTWNVTPETLWYSTLTRDNSALVPTQRAYLKRHNTVQKDVRLLCETLGMKYLSPHKLRHGHVVYAVGRAENMRQLKAISLNVMHSSVTITDQVYNRLVGEDIREVISGL